MPKLWFPIDPRSLPGFYSSSRLASDKLQFALTPLLASLGLRVPALYNEGSAALQKLKAIPNLQTDFSAEAIARLVQEHGAIFGRVPPALCQTDENAERSESAIPALIVGEKSAQGMTSLVVHLTSGPGEVITTMEGAEAMARSFLAQADKQALPISVLLDAKEEPLGFSFGAWLEIKEAVSFLDCKASPDFEEALLSIAAEILVRCRKTEDADKARTLAATALASGEARSRLDQILSAQGVALREFRGLLASDSLAPVTIDCGTTEEGIILSCDAGIARGIVDELQKDGAFCGIDQLAKVGEPFGPGCTMGRIHAATAEAAGQAADRLHTAFKFTEDDVQISPPALRVFRS